MIRNHASSFRPDLGSHWGDVLKAARTGALDQSDSELRDVARCWMGYLRKAALQLRAKLGVDVRIRLSRKEKSDSGLNLERLIASVRANGPLSGVLRVPDAAGDIQIEVFLNSRSVQVWPAGRGADRRQADDPHQMAVATVARS